VKQDDLDEMDMMAYSQDVGDKATEYKTLSQQEEEEISLKKKLAEKKE